MNDPGNSTSTIQTPSDQIKRIENRLLQHTVSSAIDSQNHAGAAVRIQQPNSLIMFGDSGHRKVLN